MEKNMLSSYEKEECLKNAIDIARAYASSGENKHGHVAELVESLYRKLITIRTEIKTDSENTNKE
jgi:hypothetical protein